MAKRTFNEGALVEGKGTLIANLSKMQPFKKELIVVSQEFTASATPVAGNEAKAFTSTSDSVEIDVRLADKILFAMFTKQDGTVVTYTETAYNSNGMKGIKLETGTLTATKLKCYIVASI